MANQLEFRLTCAGKKDLVYTIFPDTNSFESNIALDSGDFHIPPCKRGHAERCLSVLNMLPILVWFKDATSFHQATIKLCRNNFSSFNTLPLANAGFIISFYALAFSDCPCFSRYRYVMENTRISLDVRSFLFILLASAMLHKLFESNSTNLQSVILEVKSSIKDIKETLHDVIKYSRSMAEKDAMVNSLIGIFNLNMFAEESFEEMIREIQTQYFKKTVSFKAARG